ncbi:uncharacterized protein BXZ73DRAFT_9588, partial [Epithele typhae]|uniref:uncharacterized protein n=1 Tax=Epithele typhae TaxID=378194 RepID=UPI002007305E
LQVYTSWRHLPSNTESSTLAILTHPRLGHTPGHRFTPQVDSAVEALDAIHAEFPNAKVVSVSHSMGSWIAAEVLKQRPDGLDRLVMMTPTLHHILDTPNGRHLRWLFYSFPREVVSYLGALGALLPTALLRLLHPSWPAHQVSVLRRLVGSPRTILACLSTARGEMQLICEFPDSLFAENRARIRLFFAVDDDWV